MGTPELEVLKTELANNTRWAGWCTVAVFLGLIVEYTILLWLKRKDLSRTDLALTILAGIAISLGVGGEYLFGSRVSEAASKIEGVSEQRVAALNKEAGDARQKAGEAEDSAGKATVRVRELDLELGKLRTPRTLTPAQQHRIETMLRTFPNIPYELAVDPVPEAMNLVGTLDLVLRASGWAPRDSSRTDFRSIFRVPSGSQIEQEFLSGIAIKGTGESLARYRPAVTALISALKMEGIESRRETLRDDEPSRNNLHIAVGVKE